MKMSRMIGVLFVVIVVATGASANWVKVNGGYPIDGGDGISSASLGGQDDIGTTHNGRGDLVYFMNSPVLGTIMGRFACGGENPTNQWELYTSNGWANEANSIPASISNTLARYATLSNRFKVSPVPDDPEGLWGVARSDWGLEFSGNWIDNHGPTVAVRFTDEGDGYRWRQWRGGTAYHPYYLRTLVRSWNQVVGSFDCESDSTDGLVVGTRGPTVANHHSSKLVAAAYRPSDPYLTWQSLSGGGFIPNATMAATTWESRDPLVCYLDNGAYLVAFTYTATSHNDDGIGNAAIFKTGALRYEDGSSTPWSWWDGAEWTQNTSTPYASLVDWDLSRSMRPVRQAPGLVSLFYLKSGNLYELIYDERTSAGFTVPPGPLAAATSYAARLDSNGTLWLYYADGTSVYERSKPLNGSWSNAEFIYQLSSTQGSVLAADIAWSDQTPVCFVRDIANGMQRVFALSPEVWTQEVTVSLDSIPQANALDVWMTPGATGHIPGTPAHFSLDADGYLYLPGTEDTNLDVRHKNAVGTEGHVWGGGWDDIIYASGTAVDNIRGKVYVANAMATSAPDLGCGSIEGGGYIRAFEIETRDKNVGWRFAPRETSDHEYASQVFGYHDWPGDVVVDEVRGRLYVVASATSYVEVYDIANPADYVGSSNCWPKSDISGRFSGNDNARVLGVIAALITRGDLIQDPGDTTRVCWPETGGESLADMVAFVKTLSDYAAISSLEKKEELIRVLSGKYKNMHDVPVWSTRFGGEGTGDGQFRFPQGIDVDGNGNIYIADTGNHRIQKFDADMQFVGKWGSIGRGEGQFIHPLDVVVDPNLNLVYVTESFNGRVQIFDRNGNFLYSWGRWQDANGIWHDLTNVTSVVADGTGRVLVAARGYVTEFDIACPDLDNNINGIPDLLDGSAMPIVVSGTPGTSFAPAGIIAAPLGQSRTVDISVQDCYAYDVYVDNVNQGQISQYTFLNVTGPHTIHIAVKRIQNITTTQLYEDIQPAVNDASSGDIIELQAGQYSTGLLTLSGKSLTLRGTEPYDPCSSRNAVISREGISSGNLLAMTTASLNVEDVVLKCDSGMAVISTNSSLTLHDSAIIAGASYAICADNSALAMDGCTIQTASGLLVTGGSLNLANSKLSAAGRLMATSATDITVQGCRLSCGDAMLTGSGSLTMAQSELSSSGCALWAESSSALSITDCTVSGAGGLWVIGASSPVTIERNRIFSTSSVNDDTAIWIDSAPGCSVTDNIVVRGLWGIYLSGISEPSVVHNNTVVSSTTTGIFVDEYSNTVDISNCIVWTPGADSLDGCSATYSCVSSTDDIGDPQITHNFSIAPCFISVSTDNYHLTSLSDCVDAGDPNGNYSGQTDVDGQPRVAGTGVDIGADEYGEAANVTDGLWYSTIQAAIDAATTGDVIVLQPKTFTGVGNRDLDFGGKAITVRGVDPDDSDTVAATVIDCQATANDRHRGFWFHSGETASAVLEGVTITGGMAPVDQYGYYPGSAICCDYSAPTIRKCRIVGNNDDDWYACGSVIMEYAGADATVEDCTFSDNSSAGYGASGIYVYQCTPSISKCTLTDIGGGWGAIYCLDAANAHITDCTITGNPGHWTGGIEIDYADPLIERCTITNNTGMYGGFYLLYGAPVIRDCLVAGNSATLTGGGVSAIATDATFWNCTIVDNNSPCGGGVYTLASYETMYNCIIWSNTGQNGPQVYVDMYSDNSFGYCDIQGSGGSQNWNTALGTDLGGNIDEDPDFAVDGYHLTSTSPCINAGTSGSGSDKDIDGQGRLNGTIDMGADEYHAN